MKFSVNKLPPGLSVNAVTGRITGSLAKPGEYQVTLHAENAKGMDEKNFRIVVGEKIALTPPMVGTAGIAGPGLWIRKKYCARPEHLSNPV